jgi:hypothetical protein
VKSRPHDSFLSVYFDSFVGIIGFIGKHHTRLTRLSIPSKSCSWPFVRRKTVGFPRASHVAWIFVLNPPADRPMAWFLSFFCARDVLVSGHNGGINHHPCHIPILRQRAKNHLPNPPVCPAFKTFMDTSLLALFART